MIVSSTLAIILFNTLFLIILNKNSYASKSIRPQPRIIFTTLALNDLANGLLVLGVGIIPATFQCWPFGEFLCQIQVRKFNCSSYKLIPQPQEFIFPIFLPQPKCSGFQVKKRLHWVSLVHGTSHLIFQS